MNHHDFLVAELEHLKRELKDIALKLAEKHVGKFNRLRQAVRVNDVCEQIEEMQERAMNLSATGLRPPFDRLYQGSFYETDNHQVVS